MSASRGNAHAPVRAPRLIRPVSPPLRCGCDTSLRVPHQADWSFRHRLWTCKKTYGHYNQSVAYSQGLLRLPEGAGLLRYPQDTLRYNQMMLRPFHIEIMHLALDDVFSPRALGKIIDANLHQDRLIAQIGHEEYHFDSNAFDKSYAYMEEQRALTISSLMANDMLSAWSAFGRLTHSAQDFYAHSNYIDLWLTLSIRERELHWMSILWIQN